MCTTQSRYINNGNPPTKSRRYAAKGHKLYTNNYKINKNLLALVSRVLKFVGFNSSVSKNEF